MSRVLIAVTPLAGHVNPLIPVAQRLVNDGHEVFFQTADIFSTKLETAGLRFLPLLGDANYDYRRLGELIPELRTADTMEQATVYTKRVFGDRILHQYQGLQQAIAAEKIDLVMTDVLFLGELPLLLSGEPRPPVIACGVVAPLGQIRHSPSLPGRTTRREAENAISPTMRSFSYSERPAIVTSILSCSNSASQHPADSPLTVSTAFPTASCNSGPKPLSIRPSNGPTISSSSGQLSPEIRQPRIYQHGWKSSTHRFL